MYYPCLICRCFDNKRNFYYLAPRAVDKHSIPKNQLHKPHQQWQQKLTLNDPTLLYVAGKPITQWLGMAMTYSDFGSYHNGMWPACNAVFSQQRHALKFSIQSIADVLISVVTSPCMQTYHISAPVCTHLRWKLASREALKSSVWER